MPAKFIGFSSLPFSMGYTHWKTQEVTRVNRNIVVAKFSDEDGEFLTVPFYAKAKGVSEWLLKYEEEQDQDVILDALEEVYTQDGDYPIAPLFGSKARIESIIKRGHRRGYRYFELDKLKSLPFSDGMSWIDDPVATEKKSKKAKSAPLAFSRGKATSTEKEAPKTPAKKEAEKCPNLPPLKIVTNSEDTFTPNVKDFIAKKAKEAKQEPSVVKGAMFDSLAKAQIVSLIKSKQPKFDWVSDKLPKDTLIGILQQFC